MNWFIVVIVLMAVSLITFAIVDIVIKVRNSGSNGPAGTNKAGEGESVNASGSSGSGTSSISDPSGEGLAGNNQAGEGQAVSAR